MVTKELEELGDRLLTRSEVADLFHVSPSTVTRWAEAGMLPTVKTLGGHRRYEAKAVADLARQLTKQGATIMEKALFEVPRMYADHHVLEVRRILQAMPGVEDVYTSSAFHVIEVTYDPSKVRQEDLADKLSEAGYVGDLSLPVETGLAVTEGDGQKPYFRHTAAYEQSKRVVGFEQSISFNGRALWPCPGFGLLARIAEEE
jgi:excisionase family DNA binding protein